jgi:hypothetical protein
MDLSVNPEGVEDWRRAISVRGLGRELAPGYLFSRPSETGEALHVGEEGEPLTPTVRARESVS